MRARKQGRSSLGAFGIHPISVDARTCYLFAMTPNFPPTVVYSWDYAESVFDLELLRTPRLANGWKPEGVIRPVYVVVGNRNVLKHVQMYTRLVRQAVPRSKFATAESHAAPMAQPLSSSRASFPSTLEMGMQAT
jgi:hypothetical protein